MDLRLRELREARGMTLEQVAAELGTSASQIHKLETGKQRYNRDWLERFARLYGVQVIDLFKVEAAVPVVGKVGAGAVVHPVDSYALGEGLYKVRCPYGLDPEHTVAVEVEGDSMLPIEDGWLLFYSRDYDGVPSDCVGHLCVVKLAEDGPMYVKRLKPGYQAGRFNLLSTSGSILEDVEVDWAARVLVALPPEERVAA